MTERERLIELLNKYFEVGDSDFYVCNRVKEAFSVGTMSLDDFSELMKKTLLILPIIFLQTVLLYHRARLEINYGGLMRKVLPQSMKSKELISNW